MRDNTFAPTPEQQLIAAAAGGDLHAFNQLVLRYQNLAFSVACRILQDHDAAADAVQVSMIKAFRGLCGYAGGSFKSWIVRIVVNTCYDMLRSRKSRRFVSLDGGSERGEDRSAPGQVGGQGNRWRDDGDGGLYLEDPGERPEAYMQRMELRALIERGIERLPPDQRLALTLCDIHGYTYEEIGEITGMAMGTVKSRINRARARLRDYLLQYPDLLPPGLAAPPHSVGAAKRTSCLVPAAQGWSA
jgi:RNA polymerase sigma-70 factor (ECF subfamily)